MGAAWEIISSPDGSGKILKEAGFAGRCLYSLQECSGLGPRTETYQAMIMAAPDMLAALRRTLKMLEREYLHFTRSTPEGRAIVDLRAVIAKAEGHTNG